MICLQSLNTEILYSHYQYQSQLQNLWGQVQNENAGSLFKSKGGNTMKSLNTEYFFQLSCF